MKNRTDSSAKDLLKFISLVFKLLVALSSKVWTYSCVSMDIMYFGPGVCSNCVSSDSGAYIGNSGYMVLNKNQTNKYKNFFFLFSLFYFIGFNEFWRCAMIMLE